MKKIIIASFLIIGMLGCSSEQRKRKGPDYAKLKQELNLSKQQESQFDKITASHQAKLEEAFAAARSAGTMSKETMLPKMNQIYAAQEKKMSQFLNAEQILVYADFMEKNIPGKAGYTSKIMAQLKSELQLTDKKYDMVVAINQAFEKSYNGAHDKYHGDHEAAKAYWQQFDKSRKEAIKTILSDEEYQQYLNVVKDVVFRSEH
ncbi:hypothetical protein [Labilibacter marinus]|uniref:hypothetical protein n=1 Tax=Labilibacter marinus TaxID=1477105 RepID=UPI000832FC4E|nr:hypothetical protein [Labilibacter marinus]